MTGNLIYMSFLTIYLIIKRNFSALFQNVHVNLFNNYRNTRILFKSQNFIIIDKAYDLKINSNNKNEHTIQTFMKKKFPFLASSRLYHEYYFMHRLDYSTSGLMCIPTHKEACQVASKAIEERQCKKYYVALVRGYLSSNLLDLDFPIGRDSQVKEIEKMCVLKNGNTKSARTLVVTLERGLFNGYPTTKILLRPITGRRHQIRTHCSHIGHTIVGDYTYSNKKDIRPKRMYLHSLRLVIPNKIEDINVQTDDPFSEGLVGQWKRNFIIYSMNEALEKIDNHFII